MLHLFSLPVLPISSTIRGYDIGKAEGLPIFIGNRIGKYICRRYRIVADIVTAKPVDRQYCIGNSPIICTMKSLPQGPETGRACKPREPRMRLVSDLT